MKLQDFDYQLPQSRIAQSPCAKRDHARMMVLDRRIGSLEHRHFYDFPDFVRKGDVLVINDSKVIPARLSGRKETGSRIELLLLSRYSDSPAVPETDSTEWPFFRVGVEETWEALLKPGKRIRIGTSIFFDDHSRATVIERINEKKWLLTFNTALPFDLFLQRYGKAPLPPYIKREKKNAQMPEDRDRYQTIYARSPGSIAAPTAGFHFSEALFKTLRELEIVIAPVTLHVGFGTFTPIETEDVEDHVMEVESFSISPESSDKINSAERVIAVGTTSTRVLESAADEQGRVHPMSGQSRLFIYPGYRFKRVQALLTNFHLPKSSLFLLACAFAGKDRIQQAYATAIQEEYRFYSYGDCMLII
ncbi:tRNA preQ1(34) S-adenosylmethionine ribosyltransferase-isomerase QueA [Syntrophus aciditrophicus]|nr:tRNA preQ1(34) S-adenosylmethionine ribosyltransferase-isomerase QueA [Syntrophus aciditrophicus]OPY18929.1 MAG: S-adenosylmethionine:tRNA ribosyltransferase-isomerase [Syntrophus sp. PtaB.Bin075]